MSPSNSTLNLSVAHPCVGWNRIAITLMVCFVAHAQADIVYVATGYGTVNRINSDGSSDGVFAFNVDDPYGMGFDRAGNLYVAASDRGNQIYKIFPDGSVGSLASFGAADGIAIDASGNVYSSQVQGTVFKISPAGAVGAFATGLNTPTGLAVDGLGNLYVSEYHANVVAKVSPNGSIATFASGLYLPDALALDRSGNLYVANDGNGVISRITTDGQVSTFASLGVPPGSPNTSIIGLAFDSGGNLYASEIVQGTIQEITPNGTITTFASGIHEPRGIAIQVPDPASPGVMALGTVWLLRRARRSTK